MPLGVAGTGRPRLVLAVAVVAAVGLASWWLLCRHEPVEGMADEDDAAGLARGETPSRTGDESDRPNPSQVGGPPASAGSVSRSDPSAERTSDVEAPSSELVAVDDAPCDDGDPCTFKDRMRSGTCSGSLLNCNDDNPWTTDSCTGDGCMHAFAPEAFDSR